MPDQTFVVDGLATQCTLCRRAAHDAAFTIPHVRAVAIDTTAGSLTLTSTRPVRIADVTTAMDAAGFGIGHHEGHRRAS
jgi:hypothetical protein